MARSLYENGVNAVRQTEKQGIHQKGNRSFTIFSQKISTHLLLIHFNFRQDASRDNTA